MAEISNMVMLNCIHLLLLQSKTSSSAGQSSTQVMLIIFVASCLWLFNVNHILNLFIAACSKPPCSSTNFKLNSCYSSYTIADSCTSSSHTSTVIVSFSRMIFGMHFPLITGVIITHMHFLFLFSSAPKNTTSTSDRAADKYGFYFLLTFF